MTAEQLRRVIGWDDAEIEQAGRYAALLAGQGIRDDHADRWVDRLILRDREGDDRRLCCECAELDAVGRCIAAARGAVPGADRYLTPVTTILQQCPVFRPAPDD